MASSVSTLPSLLLSPVLRSLEVYLQSDCLIFQPDNTKPTKGGISLTTMLLEQVITLASKVLLGMVYECLHKKEYPHIIEV